MRHTPCGDFRFKRSAFARHHVTKSAIGPVVADQGDAVGRTLTILNVAYPLAPVGPDAAGGAEQVLSRIDEALVKAGHRSLVIACAGSVVAGTLLEIPAPPAQLDDTTHEPAQAACRSRIAEAMARWCVDAIHLHGIDFDRYLPPAGVPMLATLHLPPSWYDAAIFQLARPRTYLNCVSETQQRACPAGAPFLPVIGNGVPLAGLAGCHAKRRFALALGRICPEKGFHIALDAARDAGMPLLLAGAVFGYPAHQRYFREMILPRLARERRFIGPVGLTRKRRLLSAARCLLVPSLAPETSSLVAMEALACGTPVIAFASGALPDIVEHGRTGFIVSDRAEMAAAISDCLGLSAEDCRAAAARRFSASTMTGRYIAIYEALAGAESAATALRKII